MGVSGLWRLRLFACVLIAAFANQKLEAQTAPHERPTDNGSSNPLYTDKQQHSFLSWTLRPEDKPYASINGEHLHDLVKEYSNISVHYRDAGHQLWGRIAGTESDVDSQNWLTDKFKQIGLANIRQQPLDLPAQWFPKSWAIVVNASGNALKLQTAQPVYGSKGTSPDGLNLECVYVGLGSEADFAGRDVRGKAVFLYSIPLPSMLTHTAAVEGGTKRAVEKGAAAVFIVLALSGNVRTQMYSQGTDVPTFSLGMDDGKAIREVIGHASAGQAPRVSIQMEVQTVPNLKTATVWGELPGTTDESIIIVAHRDGWFEGATDNSSGMATMVGLAEYFSKIPKEKRRRTIIFLGTSGHHAAGGSASSIWLAAHKEIFAKTALIINCEHTAASLTYSSPTGPKGTNGANALFWYVGGSHKLQDLADRTFDEFGIARYSAADPTPRGEIGGIYKLAPSLQLLDIGMFNHSERETPDVVPATALAAATGAYAKIIDKVNEQALKDLLPDAH